MQSMSSSSHIYLFRFLAITIPCRVCLSNPINIRWQPHHTKNVYQEFLSVVYTMCASVGFRNDSACSTLSPQHDHDTCFPQHETPFTYHV
ncbi:hypothetical protein BJX62DRAFT_202194, partial [Aspergillus germanicus]